MRDDYECENECFFSSCRYFASLRETMKRSGSFGILSFFLVISFILKFLTGQEYFADVFLFGRPLTVT